MSTKESIIKIVNKENYIKGQNYDFEKIQLDKIIHLTDKSKINKFKVNSETTNKIYNVDITTKNNEIILTYCSCKQFEKDNKCKHISACLIKEHDKFFKEKEEIEKKFYVASSTILRTLDNKNNKQKRRLNLEIELDFKKSYYSHGLFVKLKIGINKLYQISTKSKRFFDLYNDENNTPLTFGKELTYDPKIHYFDEIDNEIIKFLSNEFYRSHDSYYQQYNTEIYIPDNKQLNIIKLLKEKKYTITNLGEFFGYNEEFPFDSEIIKNNDEYLFKLGIDNNYNFLSNKLLIKDKTIYVLSDEFFNIIDEFKNNNVTEIKFPKNDLDLFAKNILSVIKNKITIPDNLKHEICFIEPIVKIYLDFPNNSIIAKITFTYNEIEIDYFESSNFIRNHIFEQKIINDLLSYNFIKSNKYFEISDIDEIGNFLEYNLNILSQNYQVYTTKKLDETNIIKKNRIESQFSIGKDNIMNYQFSLDNININELSNIFDSLNEKRRYYKLKNGKILDLKENDDVKELQNFMEDMDISISNIKNGGTIPKYRAIYLDSLKNSKYHIINTDNLFISFIEKFNQYKNSEPIISKKDISILRDYQLMGVKWLYNIYKCDLGGILADEMGLGKSLQAICFIKSVLMEKSNSKILIVSPTSLIYNWQKEFDKYGNELNYCVIAESKNKRQANLKKSEKNIIITTYGLLRQDREIYEQIDFEVMIIDEAQNIKNPLAGITKTVKNIKATTKIALTGTPIENSVTELWSIFDFIMPGFLTNLRKFQTIYNIKDFSEEKIKILDNLNKQISPFIMHRKKIDVAKELPKKIENNIYFDMYPEQKKVYLAELKKTKEEMDEICDKEGFQKSKFKILQLLTKLRQICIDPAIVFENYNGNSIKIDELINSAKKIIQNNHKILIFTSFKTALEIVASNLTKEGITSYTIDGSVPSKKRMELVDKFNSDNTNVFLIMLKAGGTGLNLTSADVVIHLDLWWNPQVENQATDRAHRIGQLKNVEVIKLICKGTIEERIIELQNKKKILSDTLIEGNSHDQNLISKLSENDIKSLLNYDE